MEQQPPEEQFALALAEYAGCVKPYCFIRRADTEMISPRAFDMEYNRVVNRIEGLKGYKDNAAKFAIASDALEIVRTICYRPEGAPIIDRRFNMWKNPGIVPLPENPKLFFRHINYLIPNRKERRLFVSWLAHLVQRPDQKIMYAILVVGAGGTGKSFIGRVMERLLGEDNVVLISEEDALTSTFNGFSENKRLVFVHETPRKELEDLLDSLKGLITEKSILINRKGIERYKAENVANLMSVSNEEVKINLTNRRWAVIRAADDPYAPEGSPEHQQYYSSLFDIVPEDGTVTDELRRILHYLKTLDLAKLRFDRLVAPVTGAKEEAAEVGDLLQARVTNAYRDKVGPFKFTLLTAEEVATYLRAPNGKTLTTAMFEAGCRKLRNSKGRDVQISIDNGRPRLWALNADIAKHHAEIGTDLDGFTAQYKEMRTNIKADPRPADDVEDLDA